MLALLGMNRVVAPKNRIEGALRKNPRVGCRANLQNMAASGFWRRKQNLCQTARQLGEKGSYDSYIYMFILFEGM